MTKKLTNRFKLIRIDTMEYKLMAEVFTGQSFYYYMFGCMFVYNSQENEFGKFGQFGLN